VNEITIAVVLDGMDLTDAQWAVLEPTFRPRRRPDPRGRPWADARAVLNGVLWVLRTGAPWHDLPRRYPPYQTCHRRFQQWQRSGRLDRLLQRLAEDLRDRGKIDLSEAFVDATFASAKKGALRSVQLAAAKAPKSWRSSTVMVFLSPCTWPALHRMSHTSCPQPSTRVSSQSFPRD
jgi:transposase